MPDLPRVHTGEPLVRLSDDEITYRADRGKWTLTEALFYLTGHKPLGYESADHLQDHFRPAYHQAVDAIQMGKICRKIEQAGERVFIDSPANWFAWANGLGPEFIEIDARVKRALSQEGYFEGSTSIWQLTFCGRGFHLLSCLCNVALPSKQRVAGSNPAWDAM